MRRLPITLRLTVVFAAVTALVFAATGAFLHARLSAELDHSAEDALRSRADDVAALVRRLGPSLGGDDEARLAEVGESFSQIIDGDGLVVGGTQAVRRTPLLAGDELARARRGTIFADHDALPQWDEDAVRLLATPIAVGGQHVVAVVGMSTGDRQDALNGLVHQLLIGGPAALLLATLTAFGLARAGLAPVESMRRQAAAISAAEPGRRLPLPPTRDELSRLGTTLNAMLARLEAALARERAFVSDAGHELRTPLTILKTELDIALRHGRSFEQLHEAIGSAAEETDRLVSIAEDLLVLGRSEHRGPPARRERADVAELLHAVLWRFRREADRQGRELVADAPAGVRVVADRIELERALGNMIDNALRHGAGAVRVSAAVRGARVELHVLDAGTGFPDAFLAAAFERFTRADPARTRGGSGLGLALVDSVAVAHGGSAAADNRPSGGADVWISLPLAGEPARSPEREAPAPALVAAARSVAGGA